MGCDTPLPRCWFGLVSETSNGINAVGNCNVQPVVEVRLRILISRVIEDRQRKNAFPQTPANCNSLVVIEKLPYEHDYGA